MAEARRLIGTYRPCVLGPDGQPALRCPPDWKGPIMERLVIPIRAECGPQFTGMPVVFASRYSPGRRWFRLNGRTREIPLVAPGVDLLGSTYERDHERWDCAPGGETLCIRLNPSVIERYLPDEAHRFDLQHRYSHRDDQLVRHAFALAEEMQQGLPNGPLYAEGLSLLVLGWLSRHYAAKPSAKSRQHGSLSSAQQRRLREFIDTRLGEPLRLDEMAAEVNLSPFHFLRVFRATFGDPPHRYVMRMRLARAASLLRADQERKISDIAMETGFASQAHFTSAFKRETGATPALWRASGNGHVSEI